MKPEGSLNCSQMPDFEPSPKSIRYSPSIDILLFNSLKPGGKHMSRLR
jgi:hypothetical protein